MPRRFFFTPHSAMPTEDSHDTQHHNPREGTSRRKPSAEVNLQAEMELLRASVAKMSEKYEHLHTKNVELEHDYRTLERNWEKAQAQGSQQEFTQDVDHTQPSQPVPSHHSAPVQSRLDKGKGPLYPETTKSQLLHISPLKDRPHESMKVYKDRLLDRQTEAIPISIKPKDPRVAHLGPPSKPTHLPIGEGAGSLETWGNTIQKTTSLITPRRLENMNLTQPLATHTTSLQHPRLSPMPTPP
ncbi:unnamed protein product [Prunus brigantina]